MTITGHLPETVILLAAAVLAVSLLRALHASPILGYLVAGAVIGPYGLALISDVESTHSIAEFGVVFLLFVIGLELSLEKLMAMRRQVFGFGSAQVMLSMAGIGGTAYLLGMSPQAAILIGGGLALSSTAIVLEVIENSGDKSTQAGRLALSALILQDLAVIPLLVLVPLLAMENTSIFSALTQAGVKAVVGLVVIVAIGRVVMRPLFRTLAARDHHELFVATTLLVILGMAWASSAVGLSPTLGAFMAGLLIAETEFYAQVEADIMPFKGLLLGLFFMTVGMNIDIAFVLANILPVLLLATSLLISKGIIVIALCRLFTFPLSASVQTGFLLAQGGEFAFVLFALAGMQGLLPIEVNQLLVAGVTLTMVATPFLAMLGKRLSQALERQNILVTSTSTRATLDLKNHVIIAGFGRVGRTIARILEVEGVPYVALDMNAVTVGTQRSKGQAVYYGDAMRPIVLRALGINRAGAMIITYGDTRSSEQAIRAARSLRADLPIIVRAKNLEEVQRLEQAGAQLAIAEMFETSLQLGGALLRELNIPNTEITRIISSFRAEDYALTRKAEVEDGGKMSPNRHTPSTDFSI